MHNNRRCVHCKGLQVGQVGTNRHDRSPGPAVARRERHAQGDPGWRSSDLEGGLGQVVVVYNVCQTQGGVDPRKSLRNPRSRQEYVGASDGEKPELAVRSAQPGILYK